MKISNYRVIGFLVFIALRPALAETASLVVVKDVGGVSALPYYQALNIKPVRANRAIAKPVSKPPAAGMRYSEADLLPVHSTRLTPGDVARREIHVPGLTPLFLIGDDSRSRGWLLAHLEPLRALHAVGFVVEVRSREALDSLRRLAPDLTLMPISGDDLAQRLNLRHYPVLLTATHIEQ